MPKRKSARQRPASDEITRTRLLEAAGPAFASEGFHKAKIRDICARAGANVAAVNYHFGDKLGLYIEVLRYSVSAAVADPNLIRKAADISPEVKLRGFVRMMLDSVFKATRPAWYMKLVLQEMSNPTPAIDELVREFIRPRYRLLCELIGLMIDQPPRSRITQLCAHSVVGQARHYLIATIVIEKVWPEFTFTEKELEELTDHITVFSVAGIKAVAAGKAMDEAAAKSRARKRAANK
jgi:TetR/AcrR family transcriptional regulator, regulator of cefoperazone and chloramphenicol sensitivity